MQFGIQQQFARPWLEHFLQNTEVLTVVACIRIMFFSHICAQKISIYIFYTYFHHLWKFEVILTKSFGVRYFRFVTADACRLQNSILFSRV